MYMRVHVDVCACDRNNLRKLCLDVGLLVDKLGSGLANTKETLEKSISSKPLLHMYCTALNSHRLNYSTEHNDTLYMHG